MKLTSLKGNFGKGIAERAWSWPL